MATLSDIAVIVHMQHFGLKHCLVCIKPNMPDAIGYYWIASPSDVREDLLQLGWLRATHLLRPSNN